MKRLLAKKLLALSLLGSSLLVGSNSVKADENYLFNYNSTTGNVEIFRAVDSGSTQTIQLLTTLSRDNTDTSGWFDASQNKIYLTEVTGALKLSTGKVNVYDISSNSWSVVTLSHDSSDTTPHFQGITSTYSSQISTNTSNISTNTSNISTNTSNISSNDTDIAANASNISSNDTDIAANASNISSNASNIKNLGQGVAGSTALTAALTALPQTSKESKLSCGVGSGAYSGRYAVGFGCASKVSERIDINAGGSYVFGGSKSYGEGTLDSGVVKAGFVFKLGELNKPTHISMKDKRVMETKIETLEEKNKKIFSKNQNLENKLSILMARLEKIEKIALGEGNSPDLAVYKLK